MEHTKVEVSHTVKNLKRVESYHNTKKIWMNKVSNEKLIVLFFIRNCGQSCGDSRLYDDKEGR